MENRNLKQVISLAVFICFISYILIFKLNAYANAEVKESEKFVDSLSTDKVINTKELLTPKKVLDNELVVFVNVETGLKYDECSFMIDKCKQKNIDLFLLMGLMKKESDFNPNSTGSSGEMGLAQLMEKTARHYSEKLGYEYSDKLIYEPKTNIDLAVEHLSYLLDLYSGDEHKALTAYNRGTKGLMTYIESGQSPYEVASMSTYSVDTLKYRTEFKEQFVKFNK